MTGLPAADLSALDLEPLTLQVASSGRSNLIIGVPTLEQLVNWRPEFEAVRRLGETTGTTGLLVYTLDAPRADVAFRAFGPLRGFDEDAASSNMFACLIGALSVQGALPENEPLVRGRQQMPLRPSKLSAQYVPSGNGAADVWVGGSARRLDG